MKIYLRNRASQNVMLLSHTDLLRIRVHSSEESMYSICPEVKHLQQIVYRKDVAGYDDIFERFS